MIYSDLKSHSTKDNQKVIPETPVIIFLQQGSLCVKGFVAPENIWAHTWSGESFSVILQFGFYRHTIHHSIYTSRH